MSLLRPGRQRVEVFQKVAPFGTTKRLGTESTRSVSAGQKKFSVLKVGVNESEIFGESLRCRHLIAPHLCENSLVGAGSSKTPSGRCPGAKQKRNATMCNMLGRFN